MIKIKLDKLKWQFLFQLLHGITEKCPVKDWELESFLLLDTYKRLLHQLTFFRPNKAGIMTIGLKYAEAFAINQYFSTNDQYNIFLRMQIESQLPEGK